MVMSYYINNGNYHEGDSLPGDVQVPRRSSPLHLWDGKVWVIDAKAQLRYDMAQEERDNPLTERGHAEILLALATGPTLTPEQIRALPDRHSLRLLYEREQRQITRRAQLSILSK
jgi:hypothetical protein